MRIELAKAGLLSLDGALQLLAYLLIVGGLYLLTVGHGLSDPTTGWALAGVGLALILPRYLLALHLTEDGVSVRVVSGRRTFERHELGQAYEVEGSLVVRLLGVGAPGYHTGFFYLSGHGRVRAYSSTFSGPFVLIERSDATDLLLSPEDPEAFLEAYRQTDPVP